MWTFEAGMMACYSLTPFGKCYSTNEQAGTSDIPTSKGHIIGASSIVTETCHCPWALHPPTHPVHKLLFF